VTLKGSAASKVGAKKGQKAGNEASSNATYVRAYQTFMDKWPVTRYNMFKSFSRVTKYGRHKFPSTVLESPGPSKCSAGAPRRRAGPQRLRQYSECGRLNYRQAYWGTDHPGGDLRSVGVPSGADCCQKCAEDAQCAVAVYYGAACYLKGAGSLGGARAAPGRTAFVPKAHVPSSTPRPARDPARPAATAPFDCQHGYAKWERGWSEAKKAWCCERYEVGCAADPSNSSRPFDCDSGSASGEEQWTASQKMWCCRHRRKGCVFDCAAGVDKWQRGWSEEKKAWCCALEDVACVHNCSDGFENWEAAWTIEKKSWCCKFKNRGCVIAQTVPVTPADVTLGDNTSAVAPVATGGANTTGAVVAWTACAFEEGTDYSGHDIANSQVESKDDCCSACVNHPGCTVGVLFEGRCFLKSSTAADKVVSEGRTACALAVGAEAGDVQALSDTGSSRSDPAPGDAEAPSSGETRQSAHSSVHAGLDKTDDDPALYNCDDEEEEGWSPAKGDFCCENEGKGCPPAGVQGASAVLGRGSSELARPGRAAPVAAGAASVAATLLSIGCCYRRGPRPQRGAPCPAAGGRSRGRPTSALFLERDRGGQAVPSRLHGAPPGRRRCADVHSGRPLTPRAARVAGSPPPYRFCSADHRRSKRMRCLLVNVSCSA
ncbi:unnamed protein product, partial [Prorocentrum cordatum]